MFPEGWIMSSCMQYQDKLVSISGSGFLQISILVAILVAAVLLGCPMPGEAGVGEGQEVEDVEIHATVDSDLVQVLDRIFPGKTKTAVKSVSKRLIKENGIIDRVFSTGKSGKPPQTFLRIVARAPNLFVLHEVESLSCCMAKKGDVIGYDGKRVWKYDPEKGIVRYGKPGTFKFRFNKTRINLDEKHEHTDYFQFLSWEREKRLPGIKGHYEMTETTGPSDSRLRRRVFRMTPRSTNDGKRQWVGFCADVTLTPERTLIEKATFNVDLCGVSLLRVKLEVAEVNRGLKLADFHYRAHIPPGTPAVEVEEAREKREF